MNEGFKEISFNLIPIYDAEVCKEKHYLLDPPSLDEAQTLERLKSKYNTYKSSYYLNGNSEDDSKAYNMYKSLFSVDYRLDESSGRFVADLSFSFLHWNLIEQLKTRKLAVDQIDEQQIENIFYNILPNGNTVLHLLHSKGDVLEKLMKVAHPDAEDRKKADIHVPFIPNLEGNSPIHLNSKAEEFRYINMYLEFLAGYPIDHHSRAINGELHTMIIHDLPNFIPYLQSRVYQTEQISSISKGEIKKENINSVCVSALWTSP